MLVLKKQKIILEHYAKEDDKEIVRTIRYGSLDYVLKKLLIQERINIHNIFQLLGELYIDKGTVDLVVELKKDILTQILLAHDNDKLFKGKFDVLSRDVIESIYAGNEETLKQRVDLLSEDELYNYLNNDKVVGVVKKSILVRLGIEVDNVNNVLLLINMYDTKLVLDNYDNIRDLIYGLGIDFNSFLQYGSGSKKHSKWFDNFSTLDMIKLWQETGFDKILRNVWEKGKVMCGVSAGANCWFKECSSDSLQIKYGKDQPLIGVDCIGLVDGLFVPHCDEPGRAENVKDLLKTSSEIGLSISNCAALEIIDDEYRLITSDASNYGFEAYGLKSYWEDGEYVIESIDDSLEFKPLNELLSRNIKNKKM